MATVLAKAHIIGGSAVEGETQQLPEAPWWGLYEEGSAVEPPCDFDALATLYETNATNKACIDAKVSNIVGLGYRLVRVGPDGSEDELDRAKRLFDDCNREMTFTEVMRAVWTDVETIGNGYLEITRNSERQIDGFYHVPGTTMRVSRDCRRFVQIRDGKRQWFLAYGRRGSSGPEDLNEVLHLKKYTPQSSYYGVPDIIAALQPLQVTARLETTIWTSSSTMQCRAWPS